MNSISGEQYTVAKTKIEHAILDGKKNNPEWRNKILDIITVTYYMSHF